MRLEALLSTACEVIARRGLANTRTSDVAAAAGVSQALVFYHFETKDNLLARAFAYAADQDVARLESIQRSPVGALEKIRRIVKLYGPSPAKMWELWIDGWAEALRAPELERVSRRLDMRWKEVLTEVIEAGVKTGEFTCEDPTGSAWRICALAEGLSVQATVHDRLVTRRQVQDWIRLSAAREVGLDPAQLA